MSNTSKMLVRSLLLALSISSNFVLQAQSAALYVYYDPACMDKYTYAKEGNPGFEGYHDYHLTINDSTRYVFTVFNAKTNNVANFSSMPADFTSCANRRLSLPTGARSSGRRSGSRMCTPRMSCLAGIHSATTCTPGTTTTS